MITWYASHVCPASWLTYAPACVACSGERRVCARRYMGTAGAGGAVAGCNSSLVAQWRVQGAQWLDAIARWGRSGGMHVAPRVSASANTAHRVEPALEVDHDEKDAH
eukprot:7385807-Prymnesium_polylepis.1